MTGLLLLISTALADPCPQVEPLVAAVEGHILELNLTEAQAQIDAVDVALRCGHVTTAAVLARFWLAQGALKASLGQEGAEDAFGHAQRISPDTWVEAYGPLFREIWESTALLDPGAGVVVVEPLPTSAEVWIDGGTVGFEAPTWAGRHLVQGRWEGDDANLSRWVGLAPDERMTLPSGWVAPAVVTPLVSEIPVVVAAGEDTMKMKRKRPVAPLVIGLSGAALAGVSWGLAARERGVMKRYTGDDPQLDAAYTRHLAFSGTTVGLFALAATGVTLHFAL